MFGQEFKIAFKLVQEPFNLDFFDLDYEGLWASDALRRDHKIICRRFDNLNCIWAVSKVMLTDVECLFLNNLCYSLVTLTNSIPWLGLQAARSVTSLFVVCVAHSTIWIILSAISLLDNEIWRTIHIGIDP